MTPLETLYAQRQNYEAQIAAIAAKGPNASPTELAMARMWKRGLLSVNAQIVILEQEAEQGSDIPF